MSITNRTPRSAAPVPPDGQQLRSRRLRTFLRSLVPLVVAVVGLPVLMAESSGAAFHGENGRIAFEFQGDIWTINPDPDDLDETQLTEGGAIEHRPAWSPDASQIAFDSDRGGERNIWVMGSDGSFERQITDDPADDYNAAWSPDGSKVVFESLRNGAPAIFIVDIDSGSVEHLEDNATEPAWSPTGELIAFTRYHAEDGSTGGIWTMNADGNGRGPTEVIVGDRSPNWKATGDISTTGDVIAIVRFGNVVSTRSDGSHNGVLSSYGPGEAPVFAPEGVVIGGHVAYHRSGDVEDPERGFHLFVHETNVDEPVDLGPGRNPDWGVPPSPSPPPPPPTAVDDTYEDVPRDTTFESSNSVVDNDMDATPIHFDNSGADGLLFARILDRPSHGTLSSSDVGGFSYTLDNPSTVTTSDTFTYEACYPGTDICSEPATVTLNFEELLGPVAEDLVFDDVPRLIEYSASTLPGGGSEIYSEQLTGPTHGPFHGEVTHEHSGDFTYGLTSPFQQVTTDEFSYMLCDGDDVCGEPATVTLEFASDPIDVHLADDTVICDPGVECSVEVLGNDTVSGNGVVFDDLTHDDLALTDVEAEGDVGGVYEHTDDGVFTFTPDADRRGGTETFAYEATVAASEVLLEVPEKGTIVARVRHSTQVALTASPEAPTEGDEVTLTATVESLSDPPPVAAGGGGSGSGDDDDSPSVEHGEIDPDDLSEPLDPEGAPDDSDKADELQDRLDELDPDDTSDSDEPDDLAELDPPDSDDLDDLNDQLDDLDPDDTSDSDDPSDLTELDPPDDSGDGPTGQVEFYDGDELLGTADVGEPATLTVSDLTPGEHTITAIYGGDDVYTTSESDPLTVTVQVPPVEIPDRVPDDAGDLTITPGEVEPGGTVEVSGSGFEPNEEVLVALYSDPVTLTTTTVDDDGQLVVEVTIPDDTEPGDHEVLAHAASSSLAGPLKVLDTSDTTEAQDTGLSAAPTNRVVPDTRASSSKSGPLALTGSGLTAALVMAAFGFLVTGGLVRQFGRRRLAGHGRG